MRNALLVLALFVAAGGNAYAQAPCAASPSAPRDVNVIKNVIMDWSKAYVAHDRSWFEQHYADELSINGRMKTREEEIAGLEPVESFDIADSSLRVKFYGNVAVATGTEKIVARTADGQQRSAAGRFTNVFVQCSGRWLVVTDDWFPIK